MSGGMDQRAFHDRFDPIVREHAKKFRHFEVSWSMLRELERVFDPMTPFEEALLVTSQMMADLRNADEYFSLAGHITLTARSNRMVWRWVRYTDTLLFVHREDLSEDVPVHKPPFKHQIEPDTWYG